MLSFEYPQYALIGPRPPDMLPLSMFAQVAAALQTSSCVILCFLFHFMLPFFLLLIVVKLGVSGKSWILHGPLYLVTIAGLLKRFERDATVPRHCRSSTRPCAESD